LAVAFELPNAAEIAAVAWAVTAVVCIANVADVLPAGTVTVAATEADPILLESLTTVPPVGAGPVRVTVPVEASPPVTVVGVRVNDATVGGLIVRGALRVIPNVPLIVAIV
jgi:hypothetical protein